jgi:hypothetical protein
MKMTYTIRAGYLDSILATRNERTHESLSDALDALVAVSGLDADDLVTVHVDGAFFVYASQDEADADEDGSSASAVIYRA